MLDGLLKKQVRSCAHIAGMLASYGGKPAFFYQESPPDTDPLWDKSCYPRADYNVDISYNPERKSSGILQINIWCSAESIAMPEDIEKRFRELINGTFYSGTEKTVCAVWSRSDAFSFDKGSRTSPEIFGVTMLFELMEFPVQSTTDPDPVQGLNEWIKSRFPETAVIAHDRLPEIWKPSDESPAVYWRFAGADTDDKQSSYAVTWFIGHFAAHIIADSVTERNRWLKAITEDLQTAGEVILQDGSPMFINQLKISHNADSLRDGQLEVTGRYGVLAQHRKEEAEVTLSNSRITVMEVDNMAKTKIQNGETKEKQISDDLQNTAEIKENNSVYTADEFAGAAGSLFKVSPETVKAAFMYSKKTKATIKEARKIVSEFSAREVK